MAGSGAGSRGATPPASAALHSPRRRFWTATCTATSDDERVAARVMQRGRLVRLGPALDEVIERHGYPLAVARPLAESMVLCAMLATSLKYDGIFTLQISGDEARELEAVVALLLGQAGTDARQLGRQGRDPVALLDPQIGDAGEPHGRLVEGRKHRQGRHRVLQLRALDHRRQVREHADQVPGRRVRLGESPHGQAQAVCRRLGAHEHRGGTIGHARRIAGRVHMSDLGELRLARQSPGESLDQIDMALGGDGNGTNPEQLFAAGYGACFTGALGFVAKQAGVKLGEHSLDVTIDLIKDAPTFKIGATLTLNAPDLDKAVALDLLQKAHEVCPYSKATRGNVEVKLAVA